MATILLPPDFKEFLQLLNRYRVEYLLIGGYAVGLYGYPRATGDMDIWVAPTEDNAQRVVAALAEFGFDAATGVRQELFSQPNQVVRMGNPPLRLEILTSISGVDFPPAYLRRRQTILSEVEVSVIDLPDLRVNKAASGRLKDLSDLENLPETE